jgi:hypothetical protein
MMVNTVIATNLTRRASNSVVLLVEGIATRRTCLAKARELPAEFARMRKNPEKRIVDSNCG